MRTARCAVAGLFVFITSVVAWAQILDLSHGTPKKPEYVAGRVLVRFRPGRSNSTKLSVHSRYKATVQRRFAVVPDLELVQIAPDSSVPEAVKAYRSDTNVLYAEPDYIRHTTQSPIVVPSDPMFSSLWGLHNTGQDGGKAGADINALDAWTISRGRASVVVGIIDTGMDYTHSDLWWNTWKNTAECNNNGLDDDGNGYVDDCHGIDAINDDSDPTDDHGHGTHVAGTIGAEGNNGFGVVGVNWQITMIPCKFLDASGSGPDSAAIECLNYLAKLKQQGMNIVATNNSWGGGGFSQALYDAIDAHRQLGILFVAAAGNASSDNDIGEHYPSSYNLPNIIAVAATTRTDALASFSSFGRHTVDIAAPGAEILSTYKDNSFASMSGTSMATPHVTGAVASLAAAHPELNWIQIRNRIISSGDPDPALAGKTITGRRLNLYSALACTNSEVSASLTPETNLLQASTGRAIAFAALHVNCDIPAGAVTLTIEPGGNTITLQDDGQGADSLAGDAVYSGYWTPANPGVYTYTMAGQTGTIIVDPYSAFSVPMQWRDISGSGTGLGLGNGRFWGVSMNVPFPISIAGRGLSALEILADGLILPTFQLTNYPNYPLPMPGVDVALAPFATVLAPDGISNTRNVFWAVLGQSPNREFVVEWRDVPKAECANAGDGGVTFQMVFFENSTKILYNYKDTVFGGNCAAYDNGAGESVGLQLGAQAAVQYSYHKPEIMNNSAILWTLIEDYPRNPVPALTGIIPPYFVTSTYFNGAILLANGSNILDGTLALVDEVPRRTFYTGQSTAVGLLLDAPDFSQPRTLQVVLFNALPGGGASETLDFPINQQDFTIGLSSTSVNVTTTTPATVEVSLLPAPAVIDPVQFSCTTSDPKIVCGFSITDTFGRFEGPVQSTLTIRMATSQGAVAGVPELPNPERRAPIAAWIVLSGFTLAGLFHVSRSRKRIFLVASMITALVAVQLSCGGGTSTPPAPVLRPSASLTASPTSILKGQTSTLTWNTSNAASVTLDNGIGTVQTSGSMSVSPAATTTYRLTATGTGGSAQASTVVSVNDPPPGTLYTVTVTITAGDQQKTANINVFTS